MKLYLLWISVFSSLSCQWLCPWWLICFCIHGQTITDSKQIAIILSIRISISQHIFCAQGKVNCCLTLTAVQPVPVCSTCCSPHSFLCEQTVWNSLPDLPVVYLAGTYPSWYWVSFTRRHSCIHIISLIFIVWWFILPIVSISHTYFCLNYNEK